LNRVVIDASVAVKWVLPSEHEEMVAEAARLLVLAADLEVELIVPELFWAEVANIFTKAVRRGRWTSVNAVDSLARMRTFGIATVPMEELLPIALDIAMGHQQSAYDSIYVALAMNRETEMITADERLVNALGSRYPVRWLGGWSKALRMT
jgi:predicted nucleic acid-binding protein